MKLSEYSKEMIRPKEGSCFRTKSELDNTISNLLNPRISKFRRTNCLVTYLGPTGNDENLWWCRNINHEEITIYNSRELIDL